VVGRHIIRLGNYTGWGIYTTTATRAIRSTPTRHVNRKPTSTSTEIPPLYTFEHKKIRKKCLRLRGRRTLLAWKRNKFDWTTWNSNSFAQSNKKELAGEISAGQSGAFSAGSRICSSGVGLEVDWEGEHLKIKKRSFQWNEDILYQGSPYLNLNDPDMDQDKGILRLRNPNGSKPSLAW